MKFKVITGIMLALFLISMLTLAFNAQTGKAASTIFSVVKTRILELGDNLIHGFGYYEGYLWASTRTSPCRILKIDPETLDYERIILDAGLDDGEDLIATDGYIWVILYTSPSKIIRVDPETMAWEVAVSFQSNELSAGGSLEYAFGYLWAGGSDGKIAKIDLSSLTYVIYSYSVVVGYTYTGALTSGGGYLWGSCPHSSWWQGWYADTIVRINPSNPADYTSVYISTLMCDDMAYVGGYLYIGSEKSPSYVYKISDNLTYSSAKASDTLCYAIFAHNSSIWGAYVGSPGKIVELDSNLNIKATYQLPLGFNDANEIAFDTAGNMYVTCWESPAKIVKFSPTPDINPPLISTPSQEPEPNDVMPNQSVRVSVRVTDAESGVKSVTLSYTTDNGISWNDLLMLYNATSALYEAIIPGMPAGTNVWYKLIAYDNAGNFAVNDNAGQYYCYTLGWTFAIITDLHIGFGYPDYGAIGYDDLTGGAGQDYYLTDRLKKIVEWINNNPQIHFVVVLGDIADTAEYSEFLKAREILNTLNDPNGDGDTSDGIPYIPVIGNHDVWPYTQKAEVDPPLIGSEFNPDDRHMWDVQEEWPSERYPPPGDQYFAEVFWDESYNRMNVELIDKFFNHSFRRQERILGEPYFQNYAFSYKGIKFISLDCVTRQHIIGGAGVGPDAELFNETSLWLNDTLRINEPIIIFSHHPILVDYITAFSKDEVDTIRSIIGGRNSRVLATFAGHNHDNDVVQANFDLNELGIDVVTTEAVCREASVLGASRTGNSIRIVNMTGIVGYEMLKGISERDNLPPISYFTYKPKDPVTDQKITFYATPFDPDGSITKYEWSFGKYGREAKHSYSSAGNYLVTLTVTDSGGATNSFSRTVTVHERDSSWWENWWKALKIMGRSPINLVVTDPDGFTITEDIGEIAGMVYMEIDIDVDGEFEDVVAISEPKIGNYLITVLPEPDADPTDTYTLEVSAGNTTILLAENVLISDIPSQPYLVESTETGIIPEFPSAVILPLFLILSLISVVFMKLKKKKQ